MKLNTTISNPLKWVTGLNSLTYKQVMEQQGSTVKYPLKIALAPVNFTFQKVGKLMDQDRTWLLNQNWRYNNLGGKYINKITNPISNKFSGIGDVSPAIKNTSKFIFNDLLNAHLADKTAHLAWSGMKGTFYGACNLSRRVISGVSSDKMLDAHNYASNIFADEIKSVCRENIQGTMMSVIRTEVVCGSLNEPLKELRSIAGNSGIYDAHAFESDLVESLYYEEYTSAEDKIENDLQASVDQMNNPSGNGSVSRFIDESINMGLRRSNLLSVVTLKAIVNVTTDKCYKKGSG